jgi:putative PIN family toxin of toxin-antitoxin system
VAERPATPPLRVVLDTNVVLSALVFRAGVAARLRGLWQQGAFVPVVNRDTAAELMRVLAYPKFKLGAAEREELLADYLPYAETVAEAQTPAPDTPICRDPADQMFLDLAYSAKAEALVTGDEDLLSLRAQCPRLTIMRPAEFLQRFP